MDNLKTPLYSLLSEEEAREIKKTDVRNCTLGDLTIEDLVMISKSSALKIKGSELHLGGVMEVAAELLDRNRRKHGTFV